jgi:esterase/lipase superfamily enzyme
LKTATLEAEIMCRQKIYHLSKVVLGVVSILLSGALTGCGNADNADSANNMKNMDYHKDATQWTGPVLAPPPPPPKDYTVMRVYYATDRAPDSPKHNHPEFSSDRNESRQPLQYGFVNVSIPRRHVTGKLDTAPWIVRHLGLDNPSKYIDLLDGAELTKADVLAALSASGNDSKSVLLFVHGYNNTFDDAATRTAQIGYDTQFPGRLMFFSWPSRGRLDGYTIDGDTESWASLDLTDVLEQLANENDIQHITIIAHSMGNRMLSEALVRTTRDNSAFYAKVSHIIMAAPDIDADIFTREYASIIERAPSVTIYVSSQDKALLGSELINGYRRLGDTRAGPLVLSPIETIDASLVDSDFIGHAYISDSPSVLSDVAAIIATGLPASQRKNLISAFNPQHQAYWRIEAPGD